MRRASLSVCARAGARACALACALAAALAAARPLGAQRVIVRTRDSTSDTREALERAQREVQRTLLALEAQRNAIADDTSRAARAELAKLRRDLLEAQRKMTLEMARAMREDLPDRMMAPVMQGEARTLRVIRQQTGGYLGVYFSGAPVVMTDKSGERVMKYDQYPVIVSVEPGSPAEQAGVSAGDRVIAMGGRDVTEGTAPLDKLLQPGARVALKVRRAGELRTILVVVGRRPDVFFMSPDFEFLREAPTAMPAMPPQPGQPPMLPPRATMVAPPTPRAPLPPMAAMPPMLGYSYRVEGPQGLAGAELTPMQEGLGEYFGTDHGLLVLRLSPGTPAERAGLRSGDVLLSADGTELRSIRTLQSALERSENHSVKVELIRKKERRTVTLSW
ncbi:MAG: PDZ domain-containing protein [Gemmatimonadaceae bacterium]